MSDATQSVCLSFTTFWEITMNLRITSNLKSYLSVLFAVLMFFFISAAFASPTSPKTTIQNVLDQLVNTVERYPSDQDTSLRRKEL